jgi:hypothetical protein
MRKSAEGSMGDVMTELRENPEAHILALCTNFALAESCRDELFKRFSGEFTIVDTFGHLLLRHEKGGKIYFYPVNRPSALMGRKWSMVWLILLPHQYELLDSLDAASFGLRLGQRKMIKSESR